jgi:hypothetical protein
MLNAKIKASFLAIALAMSGGARAAVPEGCYLPDGAFSASIKAPGLLSLSVSTPHMMLFNIGFLFSPDAASGTDFVMTLPMLSSLSDQLPSELKGNWATTKPNKFSISTELDAMVEQLKAFGLNARVTSKSFNGTVSADGSKINGSFKLGVVIPFPKPLKNATIALSGTYSGKRSSSTSDCSSSSGGLSLFKLAPEVLGSSATDFAVNLVGGAMERDGTLDTAKLMNAVRSVLK